LIARFRRLRWKPMLREKTELPVFDASFFSMNLPRETTGF
jgi:hypothetical protein